MTAPLSIDRATAVRPEETLDVKALTAYLRAARTAELAEGSAALEVEQFPSGYSNLTYLIRAGSTAWVLRRPPLKVHAKRGHDMVREFAILEKLHAVYPKAPKPVLLCEDDAVIGAPFYLMERCEGVILRAHLPGPLRGQPEALTGLCTSLVDALVELHSVDITTAGLSEWDRGPGYVERQVEGWAQRFERARTQATPIFDQLVAWLRAQRPEEQPHTFVHNDFKFDNVVFRPDLTEISAVLDWEMATVGDPLMDLGTTLAYWVQDSDDQVIQMMPFGPTAAPGALRRSDVVARYSEGTGRQPGEVLYYYAFGLMKICGIVQQIFFRYKNGDTTDERFAYLDHVVDALARQAVAQIERGQFD